MALIAGIRTGVVPADPTHISAMWVFALAAIESRELRPQLLQQPNTGISHNVGDIAITPLVRNKTLRFRREYKAITYTYHESRTKQTALNTTRY